ncbi:hypothetical protein CDES_11720 [Corynebacterium deserti GIMN1.010]|uniref:DAGKc domain-containing protein n=1 Tax=Corynebacterium deserti GIMN1.010 TaxID=931089 RepID=A0A0M5IJC5_9CORY|nr:hypothetical protein CDES_11720 [Corynebacterium deserti GIMN1.010]
MVPQLMDIDDLHLEARFTHYGGHAEEMVKGMAADDFDVIIPAGGDGTVNEVINGLLGSAEGDFQDHANLPAVAVLPTGSANVFARALGYPTDHYAAAQMLVDLVRDNNTRTITLGTWKGDGEDARWFAVNAGFGIDADVIARVERARSQGFAASPLLYLQVSIRAWIKTQIKPPKIDVEAVDSDGNELNCQNVPMLLASNTNPWTFLGPLPVVTNPGNSFDTGLGLFGLTSVRGFGGVAAMMHLIGLGHGRKLERLIAKRTIEFDDAEKVVLTSHGGQRFQVDGEFEGKPERVVLESVPNALRVFAPKKHPAPPTMSWVRHVLKHIRDFLRVRSFGI